jgi:effector-binding domain-containing protein
LEQRAEQPYAAIRVQVAMSEIGETLPPLVPEVFGWLQSRGIAPAGPPFFRYYRIEMPGALDVDVGVPVTTPVDGDGRVEPGLAPAGTYATVTHTGHPSELQAATVELMRWGRENGVSWDADLDGAHETWRARFEFYLTDPNVEPDMTKWQTQLAFKVADTPGGGT